MNTLLVLWALPKSLEDRVKYEKIINISQRFFDKIYSPLDTIEFKWTDQERFDRAVNLVNDCDFIIWEQSNPSTWQWLEIGISYGLNKPLLAIAEKWSKISGLILWLPTLKEVFYYKDIEDLECFLINYFEKWI